ncbi:hypothetical protein ACSCCG_41110 [Streptomyces caniscabiei]
MGQTGPGPVTAPAVVAGATVRRGDAIAAGDDGVLCVPLQDCSHTLGHRRRDQGERWSRPPYLTTQYRTA